MLKFRRCYGKRTGPHQAHGKSRHRAGDKRNKCIRYECCCNIADNAERRTTDERTAQIYFGAEYAVEHTPCAHEYGKKPGTEQVAHNL